MATNVTNAQLFEMLRVLGYGDDILGTGPFNLSGAQNSTFKNRLKSIGITDQDFERAKNMARIGTPRTPAEVANFLGAMGIEDQAVTDLMLRAGVSPKEQSPARLGQVLEQIGTTLGEPLRKFFVPDQPPPTRAPAPLPGDVRATEGAPPAPARPTEPMRQPGPAPGGAPGGALGGTLGGGTTTGAQQTAGIRNLPRLAPNASEEEVAKYIRKYYGYSAWALDVPELRSMMIELGREFAGAEVSEAVIEGRLSSLDWWKTHSDQQRLAIEEQKGDPATYNAKVEGKYREAAVLTGQSGFSIPEARLREIARTAYDMGWNQAEIRAALSAEFDYDPETGEEETSRIVADLRGFASDYLVPLSEATIDQWGRQIIAGTSTNEDFTAYAKNVAKGMFAHYATDIDAGRTVKQIADPFIQTAARDLELTPDQIDLMDPKWRKALELDPETGQPMALSKWQRTIRTDSSYGWDGTQNARAEASEFATKIAEAFGRR